MKTDNEFFYGIPGDHIIAGDWTRYTNTLGDADEVVVAPAGSWPLVGGFLFPG